MSFRIALLSILTVCVFTFIDFLSKQYWIFPFPLFRTGLFAVIVIMLVSEKKVPGWLDWLALIWSIFLMIGSLFFLQLVINPSELDTVQQSSFLDISALLFCVFFAVWGSCFSLRINNKTLRIAGILSLLSIAGCFVMSWFSVAIIPLIIWLFCVFFNKSERSFNHAVALLFGFVFIASWITGAFASTQQHLKDKGVSGTFYVISHM